MDRSLTLDLVEKTLYEAWVGKTTSLAHIKVFGCDAFVQIPR